MRVGFYNNMNHISAAVNKCLSCVVSLGLESRSVKLKLKKVASWCSLDKDQAFLAALGKV
jgi:hypothetical protein